VADSIGIYEFSRQMSRRIAAALGAGAAYDVARGCVVLFGAELLARLDDAEAA